MLTSRFELLSSHWLKRSNGDALPLSYVSIIQKCLHPLIVFKFCYSLHLCIASRRVTKKYYVITKEGDALPLSYVSIIQKCLHPLIVFKFCYSLHLCIASRRVTKKYYVITKEELSSPIIVKFAVIKLRGGFKPHFCHTRSVVCPSWTSASSATR